MKRLSTFEKQAKELQKSDFDYRFLTFSDLVLRLMKQYKKENNIPWMEYRKTYDAWFNKYHQ